MQVNKIITTLHTTKLTYYVEVTYITNKYIKLHMLTQVIR